MDRSDPIDPIDGMDRIAPSLLAEMDERVLDQYERAPVGFLSLSVDGWIGKANQTLLGWLGYARTDLVGRMCFQDLLGPGPRLFFDTQHIALLLVQGQVRDIAVDLRARDGGVVPVLVNSVLERDAQGKPLFLQMSLFNAGERRRYERELLHARRQAEDAAITLEQRVAERTSQLASALALAESAIRAKNDFLANMSHEIRTPLNSILGMAHLVREHVGAHPAAGYLDTIVEAGNGVVRIVSEILDFCKMDAGKLAIEQVPIDPHAVIAGVANRFAGLAARRGLDFDVHVDDAVPRLLLGDALRLSQILGNYLDNAFKFTERGRVGVRARLAGRSGNAVRLRVEVEDTGIGLDAAQQAGLFQPFHQADNSTTRKYGGTGLGLAICRQLAELMDGAVGVSGGQFGGQAGSGTGSLFWFEVTLAAMAQPPTPAATPGAARAAVPRLEGAHVLLAEDNPLNQELMRMMVERTGARITIAGDGAQALAALQTQRFDCVLMDVQMPVMGGCEAARRIRRDARLRGQVVIALTANASDGSRAECFAAGMDDFMAKPIDVPAFYGMLERWLGRADGQVQEIQEVPEPAAGNMPPGGDPGDIALHLLADLVDNDPDAMAALLVLFFDNAGATVAELQAALAQEDLDQVHALGHRLKSSTRAIGAAALGDTCLALERADSLAAASGQLGVLSGRLDALRARLVREAVMPAVRDASRN